MQHEVENFQKKNSEACRPERCPLLRVTIIEKKQVYLTQKITFFKTHAIT